jgi:hypothetical protein
MKSDPGPPMTLGSAAGAHLRSIVWCKHCQHQVEPNPAAMAARYDAETPVPDWRKRLSATDCPSRPSGLANLGRDHQTLRSQEPRPNR